MTQIFHTLNTATLASWLSVAGFGSVGLLVPEWRGSPLPRKPVEIVTQVFDAEIVLGESDAADSSTAVPEPAETPQTLPSPPELPALGEQAPLPEIPDFPTPAAVKPVVQTARENSPPPQSVARKSVSTAARASANGTAGSAGTPGIISGAGSGLSDSVRLAAGRMPAPSYPSASRQAGQTGTVTVAFTVDSSGRVISAHAAIPTPWPLLNEAAVRTVRRWKFPPGGVMKVQRPITFQLR